MRALFVFEAFTRGLDPKKAMGIGLNPKSKTKSWKILDFIKNKGEEGASLKEIQYFIWTEINHKPEEEFWEKSDDYSWTNRSGKRINVSGQRKSRGYWNTNLLFSGPGLLYKYCKRRPDVKKMGF